MRANVMDARWCAEHNIRHNELTVFTDTGAATPWPQRILVADIMHTFPQGLQRYKKTNTLLHFS